MRGKLKWIVGAVVAVVLAIPVGTYIYIHFIEGPAPAKLTLQSGSTSTTTSSAGAATPGAVSGDISGTWSPTSESIVGYRVKETLFGQDAEAVGRTHGVTGSMNVSGTTISSVDLTADMTTVSSDRSQRDSQFK